MQTQFDEEEKAEKILAGVYVVVIDEWVKATWIKVPHEGTEGGESSKRVDGVQKSVYFFA